MLICFHETISIFTRPVLLPNTRLPSGLELERSAGLSGRQENLLVLLEAHREPLARVGEVECHRRDAVLIVTAVIKVS